MVEVVLEGTVTSGLGEGAFFMSMEHYKEEIKKKLGFETFSGTLNIKTDKESIDSLKKINPIIITGFKKNNKTFGGVSCYKAKINDIDGSIIMPHINKHKDNIIEFIAPISLKSELNIKDGDKVKIQIENPK